MSLVAYTWAWQQEGLKMSEKLVLLAIADAHNEGTGQCNPKIRTISERAGADERTVQRCIGTLIARGLIARLSIFGEDGRQRSNEFRLSFDSQFQLPLPGDSMPPRGDMGVTLPPGAGVTPEGGADVTLPGDTGVTPLKRTGSKEPEEGTQDLAPAAPARERDLVWDELVEHFGAVAERTNAHAKRNKAVADLKRLGATPETIRSALDAWSTVFPRTTVTDTALATHYPQLARAGGESSLDELVRRTRATHKDAA